MFQISCLPVFHVARQLIHCSSLAWSGGGAADYSQLLKARPQKGGTNRSPRFGEQPSSLKDIEQCSSLNIRMSGSFKILHGKQSMECMCISRPCRAASDWSRVMVAERLYFRLPEPGSHVFLFQKLIESWQGLQRLRVPLPLDAIIHSSSASQSDGTASLCLQSHPDHVLCLRVQHFQQGENVADRKWYKYLKSKSHQGMGGGRHATTKCKCSAVIFNE